MELGELREPMQEKELRVLFLEERSLFLERREDQIRRRLVGETPGGVSPREEIYTWVKV